MTPSGLEHRWPIVLLVHGTWPRGVPGTGWLASGNSAAWYEPASLFRRELTRLLDGELRFQVFEWSGRNSAGARAEAAASLAAQVLAMRAAYPLARIFVVAHSHGGNVAFRAAGHPHVLEKLAGIATMGTPFLYARKRPSHLMESHHFVMLQTLILLLIVGGLLSVTNLEKVSTGFFVVMTVIMVIAAATIGFTFQDVGERVLVRFSRTFEQLSLPVFANVSVLVLRCPGDEADLALRLARASAVLTTGAWRLVDFAVRNVQLHWFVTLSVGWLCIAGFVLFVLIKNSLVSPDVFLWVCVGPPVMLTFGLPFGAGLLAVLFSVIAGLLLLPFGTDLLPLGWFLEVVPTGVPVADRKKVIQVQSGSRKWRLRHSVHALPDSWAQLAEWIRASSR